MRITNLTLQRNLSAGLRGRLAAIGKAASQVSSGHRIQTVSDDPIDASQIMRMNSQLSDIDQFRRNGTFATAKLSTEDVAFSSLKDTLQQAKQLAMSTTASDPNDPTRQAAVSAIRQMRDHVIALGNTRVGDEYIFAGDLSTTQPFNAAGQFVGNTNTRTIPINDGVSIALNHSGQPTFTDAIGALDNLITQLGSGTPDQIQQAVPALEAATQQTLKNQAETGSRLKDIQDTAAQLATSNAALLDRRDAVQNVDPAEAIITLQSEQSALERAYAVVGRVLSTTLTDYLK